MFEFSTIDLVGEPPLAKALELLRSFGMLIENQLITFQ